MKNGLRSLLRSVVSRHPLPRGPVAAALLVWAAAVGAEAQGGPQARITGQVVDAETLEGLAGASVVLEVQRPPAPGDAARPVRRTVTDAEGTYRFEALRPDRYLLRVERLGYLAGVVEVDLLAPRTTRLSVGLEVAPVTLEPLEVVGRAPNPFLRTTYPGAEVLGARERAARARQAEYLTSDARAVTHADVVEAVTLGETDLYRALQRAPGVTTRDDYTATMWTRGATWDQTRVYLDGLPLYNPTHAGWLFSAINPDAVGAASFLPGHRSARWGEGAAAVLDLRTRSGAGSGEVRGSGELSLASARLAADAETRGGRFAWMLAGRRTYVDLVTGLASGLTGDDELFVPYDFADLVGRLDWDAGGGWRAEASGILEYDHLRGDIPGLLEGNRGRWGNRAGRVTVAAPLGPVHLRATAGATRFSTVVRSDRTLVGRGVTLAGLSNSIDHRTLSLEVGPPEDGDGGWALGVQLVRDTVSYEGPFSLLVALPSQTRPDTVTVLPREYGNELSQTAVWGEWTWSLGRALTLQTGARVEFGDSVYNGGEARVSPAVAARYRLGQGTILSAAWLRSYQYTQDVAPVAGPVGPQLHLSAFWLLASPILTQPAVRSDLGTVGVERWLDDATLAGVTLYRRRATGLRIANPEPGPVTLGRPPDAEAKNEADGVELSVRRLQGRWTGALGYSLGRSRLRSVPAEPEDAIWEFDAASDVRHALDATVALSVRAGWRVAGAFTYGSGVPFTRLLLPDTAVGGGRAELEVPNAERTRSYSSLDLMLERAAEFRDWRFHGYLQVRNVLNRDNAVTYAGTERCGGRPPAGGPSPCGDGSGPRDRFEAGLPTLPLIGVRITF